jgi:hypothetical protein
MKSVSGAIEFLNKNVIERKKAYRSLFDKPFQVHSSCNFNEFSAQAALVLGMDTLEATLRGENKGDVVELRKDLEGAEGWRNWDELFSILNYGSNYLVLKDFERLPGELSGEGIDFLCDDYQGLASVANVYQDLAKPYTGKMLVGGQEVNVDMRFVGDGYYSASWEKDILANRIKHKSLYVPCAEDLFFSLLYHVRVHKQEVTETHATALETMAKSLGFDWFSSEQINNDKAMGANLSGYMHAKRYFYETPMDPRVRGRQSVIEQLPKLKAIGAGAGKQKLKQLKNAIRGYFRKRRKAPE